MATSVDPDQTDHICVETVCDRPVRPNMKYRLNVTNVNQKHTSHDMTNQQNECAPSKDSDQPGYPPSLIRVFAMRSMGS